MSLPPKGKRFLWWTRAHRVLALLQAPFGFGFWFFEQAKAKLQDRIDNERGEP